MILSITKQVHHLLLFNPFKCYLHVAPITMCNLFFFVFFFFGLFVFSRAAPTAYEDSQARGLIGAVANDLHHSHSKAGSEPHLRPTTQLMATLDP